MKPASWVQGHDRITKGEFSANLCKTAKEYAAVEAVPHVPEIEGHFYLNPAPPPGDGKALAGLPDCFCPTEPIDRNLILAMFATLVWGGPPSARLMTASLLRTAKTLNGRAMAAILLAAALAAALSGEIVAES